MITFNMSHEAVIFESPIIHTPQRGKLTTFQ